MAARELNKLVQAPTWKAPSATTAGSILSLIREARLPRSDLVLQLGDHALSRMSARTRAYWDVLAQICGAAGEGGEYEVMDSTFAKIIARFPHSPRAFILLGRAHEVKGKFQEAMDTYIGVLKEEPMVPAAYKRQVAVLKSEEKLPAAVSMLNYYLSLYSDDTDAWAELCSLCLALGRFTHAVFAANELVVADPGNHAYQTLAGDVYMTCGGEDNLIRAREHYASSLMARKYGNLRALFGLFLACSRLLDNGVLSSEQDTRRNDRLLVVAQEGIRAVYGKLRNESGSASVGSAALVVINANIVTGKQRPKHVS